MISNKIENDTNKSNNDIKHSDNADDAYQNHEKMMLFRQETIEITPCERSRSLDDSNNKFNLRRRLLLESTDRWNTWKKKAKSFSLSTSSSFRRHKQTSAPSSSTKSGDENRRYALPPRPHSFRFLSRQTSNRPMSTRSVTSTIEKSSQNIQTRQKELPLSPAQSEDEEELPLHTISTPKVNNRRRHVISRILQQNQASIKERRKQRSKRNLKIKEHEQQQGLQQPQLLQQSKNSIVHDPKIDITVTLDMPGTLDTSKNNHEDHHHHEQEQCQEQQQQTQQKLKVEGEGNNNSAQRQPFQFPTPPILGF